MDYRSAIFIDKKYIILGSQIRWGCPGSGVQCGVPLAKMSRSLAAGTAAHIRPDHTITYIYQMGSPIDPRIILNSPKYAVIKNLSQKYDSKWGLLKGSTHVCLMSCLSRPHYARIPSAQFLGAEISGRIPFGKILSRSTGASGASTPEIATPLCRCVNW